MNRIKLIAFDLDGTICNTLHDIAASLNRALLSLGFPTFSDDAVSAIIGKSVVFMCQHAVPAGHEEEWPAVRDAFYADYLVHLCDNTVPYPEMAELLLTLKQQGYRLAVVTNKPDPHAKKMLRILFPADRFDAVLGQDPAIPNKPNSAMLDRVRKSRSEQIREVKTVDNPFEPGTKVERPAFFENSWLNSRQDMMLLSDRSLEPNTIRGLMEQGEWLPAN